MNLSIKKLIELLRTKIKIIDTNNGLFDLFYDLIDCKCLTKDDAFDLMSILLENNLKNGSIPSYWFQRNWVNNIQINIFLIRLLRTYNQ